jgi:MurNAc alpha-1-phosphate uridylyltransferase
LLVYQLEALAAAGITDIVIHISYLADVIINELTDGKKYGLDKLNITLKYSHSDEPLESGGGIAYSTALLADPSQPFICINGKIFTDFDYSVLNNLDLASYLGHLVLVPNPSENPNGDFNIDNNQYLSKDCLNLKTYLYTYSGIAVYNTKLIMSYLLASAKENKKFSMANVFNNNLNLFTASVYNGAWYGLETVERYNELKDQRIIYV